MSESILALYVFVLACFIGYYVIWGVTPSLHTPLVALTNAISGIVLVGALLVTGLERPVSPPRPWASWPCCWPASTSSAAFW
jgi:NAD/NADP transhydrogenase alpha subunit